MKWFNNLFAINKIKRQNAELMLQASTMQTIFDSIPDILFVKDTNSCFLQCNHAMEVFFGCRAEDIIGKNEIDALGFDPLAAEGIFEYERLIFADGRQVTIEEKVMTAKGECSFETIKAPLRQNGTIVGLIGVVRDISKHKEMEEKLLSASKAKSDFLARMSHEIRTPINAILGISEIVLQDETLTPSVQESASQIYNSGDLLLGIINDILDLSKIEAGKFELRCDKYELASLISDTMSLNIMRIGSKPIEFVAEVDENLPSLLQGDELRVKQILNNLLSNAFKYTEKGTVKLSIYVEKVEKIEGGESDLTIGMKVSDTGQGMTEEQVKRLFEEYSRFNTEANANIEGAGLGMNITQNLINIMNGKIFVKSEPNWGSVFTVLLPQKRIGSDVLGKELAENLQNFRTSGKKRIKSAQVMLEPMPYGSVLVVDDVEANLYVAKGLMTPYKLSIETASSGFEAIEKIKSGNIYDIVFMDHMMPRMDGVETVKNIREYGYARPIVALTANAVVGQSEMFLANGFDDFISKPIDVRQLNAVLKKFVQDRQTPHVIETARRQKPDPDDTAQLAKNPKFAEIFARDIVKSIAVLEETCKNPESFEDEDIKTYTISVHGLKSSLAYMGESALSQTAAKLEQAGRNKDAAEISAETPRFLSELRALVEKLKSKNQPGETAEPADDDRAFLRKKLLAIKDACEAFDKKVIKAELSELEQKTWSEPVAQLFDKISEHLLSGDYAQILTIVESAS